jgi:hypothetical protein
VPADKFGGSSLCEDRRFSGSLAQYHACKTMNDFQNHAVLCAAMQACACPVWRFGSDTIPRVCLTGGMIVFDAAKGSIYLQA